MSTTTSAIFYRKTAICCVMTLALVLVAGGGRAASFYVTPDGLGDAATVQLAVNAASAGDTVLLGPGVFTGAGNYDIDFFGKDLVLTSEVGPHGTVIDCQGNGRGFTFTSLETPLAVVEGVTIMNGYSAADGGGINVNDASPTIRFCILTANHADGNGGAMRLQRCNSTVENNTLTENTAIGLGAGISVGVFSAPQISYNIIANSPMGAATACNGSGANPTYTCNDLFGNVGGDAICGTDGGNNASSDPEFCGSPGSGNFYLQSDSPCQPAFSGCGVLVGALGVSCSTVATQGSSWGALKATYHE